MSVSQGSSLSCLSPRAIRLRSWSTLRTWQLIRLALFQDLVRVADLAGPAHVGDMKQAVDAFLDLDEGAVVGEVADRPLDHRSGRILAGDLIPGIDLGLLHAQGDLLLVAG